MTLDPLIDAGAVTVYVNAGLPVPPAVTPAAIPAVKVIEQVNTPALLLQLPDPEVLVNVIDAPAVTVAGNVSLMVTLVPVLAVPLLPKLKV